MKLIKQFPHCDPRILHAPGECRVCDLHPDWQELREYWQIAFTGKDVVRLSDDPSERVRTEGAVLPCPFNLIRGNSVWHGNLIVPPATECPDCKHSTHRHDAAGCFARKSTEDNGSTWRFICSCTRTHASFG